MNLLILSQSVFLRTAIGTPIELSEDSTREDLYDLLDEWLPGQEFDWLNIPELEEDKNPYLYTASIALEQFLNAPDYSSTCKQILSQSLVFNLLIFS